MGIRIPLDSDDEDQEYRSRRFKRVRISEINLHGSPSVFSPTSNNDTPLHRFSNESHQEPQDLSNLVFPIIRNQTSEAPISLSPDSGRTTLSLRRRNAIRRGYLEHYPYSQNFRSRRYNRVFLEASRNFTPDEQHPSVSPTSERSTISHSTEEDNERAEYDLWLSTDDISAHISNFMNYRGSPQLRSSEQEERILPVVPPPLPMGMEASSSSPPRVFNHPSAGNVPLSTERFTADDDTPYLTFDEYNRLGAAPSSSASPPSSLAPPPPRSILHNVRNNRKIWLPHINSLIPEPAQLLHPRNERALVRKAEATSRQKFGKLMASGITRTRNKNIPHKNRK